MAASSSRTMSERSPRRATVGTTLGGNNMPSVAGVQWAAVAGGEQLGLAGESACLGDELANTAGLLAE